ncbi:uncharacterized protein MYCFIDRAFT_205788 [Pseudocercospora fijiensis CIRAD86]|uniref:Uncharacterized protein n=1 Tax=Pseudocercospora fijiensis (strain CIRAD86) TaxID=383855 RepID=N1QA37_PSEFD|nr:uncharacterized protein MYCFIDRAFT_205788 [Pseudocercospora fijiensis CIRAD86]EME87757.1 hypothetical protein MYCFIDRAFT_205788 [Pseudocercospora fijiensis CIRAD86]
MQSDPLRSNPAFPNTTPHAESTLTPAQLTVPEPYNGESDEEEMDQRSTSSFNSYATSSVSAGSSFGDYGLHRALNSVVVPNEDNPIATVKDRKNANYLERLGHQDAHLRAEIKEAFATYEKAAEDRDDNSDPKKEAFRNREYFEASVRLARASQEYTFFQADLNELRDLPKLSRDEMKRFFTNIKAQERLDRAEENNTTMREKLRQTQSSVTSSVATPARFRYLTILTLELSEHVAYQAHLLTHKTSQIDRLSEHTQYVEHLNDTLRRDYMAVCDTLVRHNEHVNQLNENLQRRMTFCANENEALKHTLDQQNKNCQTLMQYGNEVKGKNNDVADLQYGTTGLHTTIDDLQHDNVELQRDITGLQLNMGSLQSLQQENEDLKNENVELQRDLDYHKGYVKTLETKLYKSELHIQDINKALGTAKIMASQRKDEAEKLRITAKDLNEALENALGQMEQLQLVNNQHMRNQEHQQGVMARMRASNNYLRSEFKDLLRSQPIARRNATSGATSGASAGRNGEMASPGEHGGFHVRKAHKASHSLPAHKLQD